MFWLLRIHQKFLLGLIQHSSQRLDSIKEREGGTEERGERKGKRNMERVEKERLRERRWTERRKRCGEKGRWREQERGEKERISMEMGRIQEGGII